MKKNILKRVGVFLFGILLVEGADYVFSLVVYPLVLYIFGLVDGTIILFIVATVTNYFQIRLYDKLKTDIFSFEWIKKLLNSKNKKVVLVKTLHFIGLIILIVYDPFLAVLYHRKNNHGLVRRDYINLVVYTFIGCALWSSAWFGIYELIEYITK